MPHILASIYEFRVMTFGLCNSPVTFQKLMDTVLSRLTQKSCMVYIDNVLVIGKTFAQHLDPLREVFKCLGDARLRLKLSVDLQAQLRDVKTLHSFLGLDFYYRRFGGIFCGG